MLSQQYIIKFLDINTRNTDTLLSLVATPLINKRSRCFSLPEVCPGQKTEKMPAVNLEHILQKIVELRQENKDCNQQLDFINLKFDDLAKTVNEMKSEIKAI